MRSRRAAWPLLAFLGAVFLLKLVVVLQLKDHPLTQPDVGLDTSAYVSLARQVASGDIWLTGQAYFVSPLYIYFLAGGLAVTDSFTAVRVLQIALGTLAVWFVFLMGQEWFGRRAAWIAAGLASLTGLFTFYESLILQASLDVFLTAAALLALTFGLRAGQGGRAWFFLSGLVFGFATLNRPNMLAAALAVALAALATRRIRPAVLLVAGILAGMAPVTLRNVLVTEDRSLVSSHGGLNFYIGNGEGATGFYHPVQGISPTIAGQEKDTRRVASKALGRPVTQAEASDYFYDLAWAHIRDQPGAALALFFRKLGYVFHAQHIALPYSFPFFAYDANTSLRWYAVGPWILIPLGLVGLSARCFGNDLGSRFRRETAVVISSGNDSRGRLSAYLIWVSFVPAYAISVAVFFLAERYRLPVLIPLVVGAGGAVDALSCFFSERRTRDLAAACGVLAVLFGLVNWRHGLHDGRWEEGLRMAERLVILGRYDEADEWTRRIEPNEPQPGAARYALGLQSLAVGQPARAVPYLTAAAARDPDRPDIQYALGQALLKTGKPREAVPHLSRGFEGGLDMPLAGYDLAVALRDTGDFARAADIARRIVPRDDDDAEVWLRVGRLAAQSRAPEVADGFFKRGAALAPGNAAARQQYGLNLLLLGRFDQAAIELAEAVRLDPRDPDSLAHLAYAEFRLGRLADARQHADAALAIRPDHDLAGRVRAGIR
jgi:tetratricopeptide (TPR) repeat protein/4-amino-4-deoxy-L-arabinose transferase-like glycosyltransferase